MTRRTLLVACLVSLVAASLMAASLSQRPLSPIPPSPSTTTLVPDRTSVSYGETFRFTVTVTSDPSVATPTGAVWLVWDTTRVNRAFLVNGQVTFEIAGAVGNHTVRAEYEGDINTQPSVCGAILVTVSKAKTFIDAKTTSPYLIGGPSPVTVSVQSEVSPVNRPRSGNLLVTVDGAFYAEPSIAIGTVLLDTLSAGDHTVVLSYAGDDNFEPSSLTLHVAVLLPAFSISCARIAEGNSGETTVLCPVTLSQPIAVPARVTFATVAGTATEGVDYEGAAGVIEFGPRVQLRVLELKVFGDTVGEDDETFSVVLSNPENATLAAASAGVIIGNDDPPPSRKRPSRH